MSDELVTRQRADLKWAAIDFDGTLCESTWTADNPSAPPGEPIWGMAVKMAELWQHGFKIVIHTSRGWADYEIVESWLNHWSFPFHRIVCGKLLAKIYVDDRNVHMGDDWLEAMQA